MMSRKCRGELNKCRELLWMLLWGKLCHFCNKPLVDETLLENGQIPFGTGRAPAIVNVEGKDELPTIHHDDGKNNPRNNEYANLTLAHALCHRKHHASETRQRQLAVKASQQKEAA